MNCKFKFHLRTALPRGAARAGWAPLTDGTRFTVLRVPRVRARKPSSLALRAGGREPGRRPGSFFRIFRSTVRARKPNSLALRAGGREPRRPAGFFFRIFRSTVRARKPSSLALRAGVREPRRRPGSFFRIFKSAVRARKPSSLTLRADVREPRRPGSCVQMKRDARKAPPASVHLFPLLYFQKERIDDELTLSPRRRQF